MRDDFNPELSSNEWRKINGWKLYSSIEKDKVYYIFCPICHQGVSSRKLLKKHKEEFHSY